MNSPIEITPAAQDKIRSLLDEESDDFCFRAQIEGGGCQGLRYVFSLDTPSDQDHCCVLDGIKLLLDDISYDYLEGARIDYEVGPLGEQFTVHNPRETSRCSCGSSFNADN